MGPHDFSGSVGPFFVLETGQRDGWRRSEMTETLTRTRIRALRPADWQQVARIYEEGMLTGNATFETSVPSWEEWDAGHLAGQRLVVTLDGDVAGWAALSPISDRACYRGVAEHSIYIAERARGLGLGRRLLAALVSASETAGIWTLQAGIFPENDASIALHCSLGFRIVGVRERLGRMNAVWRDVVLLERRSEMNA
jgi:L-amino acid N-acyltransferase YncA